MPRPRRKSAKTVLTLQISTESQCKLRTIAKSFGLLVPSGANTGEGSISALMNAIAESRLKIVKVIMDGNPTEIFFDGILTFSAISIETGEQNRLATKEEYEHGDRCVGSVFESLAPGENIHLQDGYYVLDEDLDLVQDWQVI